MTNKNISQKVKLLPQNVYCLWNLCFLIFKVKKKKKDNLICKDRHSIWSSGSDKKAWSSIDNTVYVALSLCTHFLRLVFLLLYPSITLLVHTSLFFHFLPPVSHQVRVSMNAVCRGDLSISLESPGGTVSVLLDTRPNDDSTDGLKNWTFMTVHCWGEQPRGLWTLQVREKNCCYLLFVISSHTGNI